MEALRWMLFPPTWVRIAAVIGYLLFIAYLYWQYKREQ
jgi:hypothetical protein